MACAQTGSGKTVAFCFPIISAIMRSNVPPRPRAGRSSFPLALILSPTRELSMQAKLLGYIFMPIQSLISAGQTSGLHLHAHLHFSCTLQNNLFGFCIR
ncbi:DEAD-box ATP-dependent RNA helicase 52B [Cryptomeria japonica]|uniref:DEAD-box ATP-dependent RNA helicase 52B n=1 Tax=Cryptomeria japonica TaxID=3369 RepID=UPI0025AD74B6|nr:DEAD-box ATP-dependent RNA helicase 52B [Cryptomeria japonica]